MARTALIVKTRRAHKRAANQLANGQKPTFSTRLYHRCSQCGRNHGYMRRFGLCRICFREKARSGKVMGLKKSSW